MRAAIIVPFCLAAAACSGGGGEAKKEAAEIPASLPAGQWETSFETTAIRSTDQTTPALEAKAGDKETASACVAAADAAKPPADLIVGEGYACSYKSSYIRAGRLNASLSCRRDGIQGELMMSVTGNYTADTLEGTVETTTYLPGDGDFSQTRSFTGRKTSDTCTPETEGADGENAAAERPLTAKSGKGAG